MNREQERPGFSEVFDRELEERKTAKASTVGKSALWPELPPVAPSPEQPAAAPEDQQ